MLFSALLTLVDFTCANIIAFRMPTIKAIKAVGPAYLEKIFPTIVFGSIFCLKVKQRKVILALFQYFSYILDAIIHVNPSRTYVCLYNITNICSGKEFLYEMIVSRHCR